jgi:circadian clock protein KaiC
MSSPGDAPRLSFGVAGLDGILQGGIPRDTLFLVQGAPGAGKTTLGLQFLLEGAYQGEACLLVSNAETAKELAAIAASHGWDLGGIEIIRAEEESSEKASDASDYTLFPAAEVEVGESLAYLFAQFERVSPRRLVIDSISGLRVLAREPAFYRRQLQRLREFLSARSCTTILLDDAGAGEANVRTQTIAHGFLELEQVSRDYGGERRRLRVRKLRGSGYVGGYHDFVIETGGVRVYPRLVAAQSATVGEDEPARSGVAELDAHAGGGLGRGSSTLLMGPAGAGKSTLATLYMHQAATQGERSALYLFDESEHSFVQRSRGLGLDVDPHIEAGRILLTYVDPAELTPGQIAHRIVEQVERQGVRLVTIDSLNGYLHGAQQEHALLLHLRELLSYLSRQGVVSLLVLTQHGILGAEMSTPVDVSFIADNVFLLRFFEARGAVRQALSMVKRRAGPHERTIRELLLEPGRVRVGKPLADFSGVLGGTPTFAGRSASEGGET